MERTSGTKFVSHTVVVSWTFDRALTRSNYLTQDALSGSAIASLLRMTFPRRVQRQGSRLTEN